jgi:hypothetical protein
MILPTYEADTLSIRIPVTKEGSGQPLDLTGADIKVIAQRSGRPSIQGSVWVEEPESGVLIASFQPETFTPANYVFQCRITTGGVTQTVVNTQIRASKSLRVPA